MKRIIIALAAALMALAVVVGPVSAWTSGTYDWSAENRMADLIQREHARACGSSIPIRAYQHRGLSRWRAKDMVVRDYFSHTIKGTSNTVFAYFRKYGIEDWTFGGENIGWTGYADYLAADHVFKMFMESPGHRALIRECRFNAFNVGSYKAGSKKMFTVTFSRQPSERVAVSRLNFRTGPGTQYGIRFVARYGERQFVFKHRYDRYGRRWDFGAVRGRGWAYTADWLTR